jgi:hypothetical protein
VIGTILQFLASGILVCLIVWLKFYHVERAVEVGAPRSPKLTAWIKAAAHVGLGLIAAGCLLDPLIPGEAGLTIKVSTDPSTYPTLLENLRARVIPVGFQGPAGGNRVAYAAFGRDGSAEVVADLALLETQVQIEIFDQTRPSELIKSTTVYLSPFVRRQLINKTVSFQKGR